MMPILGLHVVVVLDIAVMTGVDVAGDIGRGDPHSRPVVVTTRRFVPAVLAKSAYSTACAVFHRRLRDAVGAMAISSGAVQCHQVFPVPRPTTTFKHQEKPDPSWIHIGDES